MIGGLNLSMDVIVCKSYSKKSLIDFPIFYKNFSHGETASISHLQTSR